MVECLQFSVLLVLFGHLFDGGDIVVILRCNLLNVAFILRICYVYVTYILRIWYVIDSGKKGKHKEKARKWQG